MFTRFCKILPAVLMTFFLADIPQAQEVQPGGKTTTARDISEVLRVQMIDGAGTRKVGVDTLTETESDTSVGSFNFAGADVVLLYTYGRQLTSNDTVFVNFLVKAPYDTLGITSIALDTLLGDAGHAVKDVSSLVNTYARGKFRIFGGSSSGVDSTEVLLGVEVIREGG